MSKFVKIDAQNVARCWWCGADPLYTRYHDREWGNPVKNDQRMFEKICLEGFQAGLSWITILKKRESFREAFDRFEVERVAKFSDKRVRQLVKNPQIIRHRGKILATINNARRAIELAEEFGSLAKFFWSFEPKRELKFNSKRAITTGSEKMSRELKRLGWKFVGPTTCYSFMQSMGIVNDHHPDCVRWNEVRDKRSRFRRP